MSTEHVHSRTSRRLRTEEKIISAAADLFLELGYKATTVRGIAKHAEVSVGRVMAAGDKDVLLVRCYDRWIGQLQSGTYTLPARARAITEEAPPARGGAKPAATSAVQNHLVGTFLPFLEFFAAHEDLSRDYAAALMRVAGKPQVFETLATDLQDKLSSSLISIGISEAYSQASAVALYDSYLGILFRWAASDMSLHEATDALSQSIAFHTQLRRPV
ncbi:TetR/AcrR family transcriptional regulator [Brevibacterium aurantiacum]|uniref:TetR/AcrR family transcriptional regulator n=1 Tax=Brevibacterium aurantiacum TaxID=273384 RepID=UPI000DF29ABD|nr:helix-turn-helix domain-containing protein [Brevibacterium aurantiacum]RCS97860.1 TetR/AcrR family transcriptional regulator [Brevibacterium aurantiacum]